MFNLILVRNGMLSSTTLNNLTSYSNSNKQLKFINTTSVNDFKMCSESITTPIRLNKNKFTTPISTQRRALGLVNHNSNRICRVISTDDLSELNTVKEINNYNTNKYEEPIVLQSSTSINVCAHSEDDLPHCNHSSQDTFDDLIPNDERIERMIRNQTIGISFLNCYTSNENIIRCQSPVCANINKSTLLDMIDI
ncbi:unnamed protein product [Rotaria socialis]|uniref:Uncharacterized protein n=1 Tax=Rotaria socialis TaxID=392032 RepID=A0A820XBS3_9BILA|nr:unnamed protein product [Rotaria socialis]CAF3411993.1 unnamed protein product [Rotaria socialis]CAF3440946.1 unnamed protein product [Rotaria socialis]CAF3449945.1 unnamed protein product [Rotaria socialis]CAF3478597.1 unnamed protein product [Rotaria socialis]